MLALRLGVSGMHNAGNPANTRLAPAPHRIDESWSQFAGLRLRTGKLFSPDGDKFDCICGEGIR